MILDFNRPLAPQMTNASGVLDLSSNDLGNKTGVKLLEIFRAIPASVTALNLSKNDIESIATLKKGDFGGKNDSQLTLQSTTYNRLK
jgi:hypothetical protein